MLERVSEQNETKNKGKTGHLLIHGAISLMLIGYSYFMGMLGYEALTADHHLNLRFIGAIFAVFGVLIVSPWVIWVKYFLRKQIDQSIK